MRELPPDRATLADVVDRLREAGTLHEPNEELPGLTILSHGLQCAAQLRRTDPDDVELQVAGLLHDLGHVLAPGCEDVHGAVGAAFVGPVFGERVAALVEGHVPAKRFLVTVDASYRAQLSEGSVRTLALQGETMTDDEVAEFRASRYGDGSVRLRRADEAAKDPAASVPSLEHWLPILERAVR